MKRFVALFLMAAMLLSACSSALAFSGVTLDCAENKSYVNVGSWTASDDHVGKVYIYHTVSTSSAGYTNHFRIYVDGATSANNNKWVTPGTNTPISSSAIEDGSSVLVKARGNTKYNDDGYSTIKISGTIGWPL